MTLSKGTAAFFLKGDPSPQSRRGAQAIAEGAAKRRVGSDLAGEIHLDSFLVGLSGGILLLVKGGMGPVKGGS